MDGRGGCTPRSIGRLMRLRRLGQSRRLSSSQRCIRAPRSGFNFLACGYPVPSQRAGRGYALDRRSVRWTILAWAGGMAAVRRSPPRPVILTTWDNRTFAALPMGVGSSSNFSAPSAQHAFPVFPLRRRDSFWLSSGLGPLVV